MTPIEQVRAKCADVVAKAKALYGVDLNKVAISFDLKGRVAGWAQHRYGSYKVRFNHDMITRGDAEALRGMIEDTVPHELAHIVCYMRRELGKNHDHGWVRVCIALGGTGKRTHDTEVVYGKGITYEYVTDRGCKVRMGERHHNAVLRGVPLRYKKGKGTVTLGCAFSIVGHQGKTLAAPIVKKAVSDPKPVFAVTTYKVVGTKEVLLSTFFPVPMPTAPAFNPGESKASIARAVMLAGHNRGMSGEEILQAIMFATGHDRQLSKSYYKNNAARVGIPYNL